jgi:hypothetical protein
MLGRFKGGIGEFFGDETVDGKRVLCHFYWEPSSALSARGSSFV